MQNWAVISIQRNRRTNYDRWWHSVKGLFRHQTLMESKLVQLDKVSCKWCTAIHSEGKHVTGCMIIEGAKSIDDEIKVLTRLRAVTKNYL